MWQEGFVEEVEVERNRNRWIVVAVNLWKIASILENAQWMKCWKLLSLFNSKWSTNTAQKAGKKDTTNWMSVRQETGKGMKLENCKFYSFGALSSSLSVVVAEVVPQHSSGCKAIFLKAVLGWVWGFIFYFHFCEF